MPLRNRRGVGTPGRAFPTAYVGQPRTVIENSQSKKFVDNAWFDAEGNRKPRLPGAETGSVYHVDPKLVDVGKPTMRITSPDGRLADLGARAWKPLDAAAWTAAEPKPAGSPSR